MKRCWFDVFVPIAVLSTGLLLATPAMKCEAKEVGPAAKSALVQCAAMPLPASAETCYVQKVSTSAPAPDIALAAVVTQKVQEVQFAIPINRTVIVGDQATAKATLKFKKTTAAKFGTGGSATLRLLT
jgi:hypothetical protein